MLPLITEVAVAPRFPELNRFWFNGILVFTKRAQRHDKVNK